MPAGFRIYDEAARLVYDDTTNVGRIIGSVLINSPAAGGVTDPDLLPNNQFYLLMSESSVHVMDITFSGNTIYWSDARWVHDRPWAEPITDYSAVLKYGNY